MQAYKVSGIFSKALLFIGLVVAHGPTLSQAKSIAVIGTGEVGAAIGAAFARQGHSIVYGSRDPEDAKVRSLVARTGRNASATQPVKAAARAQIVVLAVPGVMAESVVRELGDLSGKIILDPTNRVVKGDDGHAIHGVATSNAELIQALAPGAHVVKAFNTLSARTMVKPNGPVTIPLAGNDVDAKATVAQLVTGMGFEPFDVGPLRYAHVLEEMLVMWYDASATYDYHFRRRPLPDP